MNARKRVACGTLEIDRYVEQPLERRRVGAGGRRHETRHLRNSKGRKYLLPILLLITRTPTESIKADNGLTRTNDRHERTHTHTCTLCVNWVKWTRRENECKVRKVTEPVDSGSFLSLISTRDGDERKGKRDVGRERERVGWRKLFKRCKERKKTS